MSASTPAEALAEIAECDQLGPELATASEGEIYTDCATTCAAKLCKQALVSLWAKAQNGGADLSTLNVAVTGPATVDNEARPTSLVGTWVGTLDEGKVSIGGGDASASMPSPE